jgi:ABC-2 type transport system permease protein
MNTAMGNIKTMVKRELSSYFTSPVAYIFIVIFLLLAGFFTFMLGYGFFEVGEASLNRTFFVWHPWLFLFLVPAVGMRVWSEERRMGTLELLLTMPVTAWQAIVAKFVASWAFLLLALLLTFPLVVTINYLGDPDNGMVFTGYFGSFLMAGAYLAISCMTSAMTRNQVVSFILSVVICLLLIFAAYPPITNMLVSWAPVALVNTVTGLGVMTHFQEFQKGVLDLRHMIYFLSLMVFSLFATSVIIRNHRAG